MMIIDYNGIAMGNIIVNQKRMDMNEDTIRHMILNSIRMHVKKHKDEYGQVVIACDGGSWRRDVFPQYKWARRNNRTESSLDFDLIFKCLNMVREEISLNMPYKVVHIPNVEADDIIGTLVEQTQEFGQHEDVMIISADKDFIQLQKYGNVKQYSPMTKKFIKDENPHSYLFEHVLKGDSSDGIPNVLSGDDTFVESIRQSPMTKKKIQEYVDNAENLQSYMSDEVYRNYKRNQLLVDLAYIPAEIKKSIIDTSEAVKVPHRMKILNYLIKNRCKLLIECIEDF
jgi:5'-3' exonuclease